MFTQDFTTTRIKLMALSRIRQIEDEWKLNPVGYKKDTREYCDAMYDILDNMAPERLENIVAELRRSYAEMGMDDEEYIADSLMTMMLAMYQNEIGEQNVYDLGWDRLVEDFFHSTAAV